MASGTLVADTTQVNAGGQVTLTVAISGFDDNTITLSADNDPGDSSGWRDVTLDANQGASVTVTLANAGSYTFTLNIDGTAALDGAGNAVTAGPITAAAPTTTTTLAPTTTTTAPATTTTAPSTTTTAPATTTTAPSATTTAPASTTTAPSATTTAPASTTTAPSATTTAPASTTTAPSTTTTAPASTTTAPSTTTTAPASTTTAPSTTTTAPASTTTAPSTTTTAPASTTTAPSTTTTAPSTTTTAGPPSLDDFSGKPKEDDGLQHDPASLQIELGKAVVLSWKISSAPDGVELTDPAQSGPQKFDANTLTTEVTPQDDAQDYSMVAVAGDQRSESKTVHVSTHPAGHVYSPHAQVLGPGQAPVINYFRILAQGGDVSSATESLTAAPGATVTLAWELEGDVAKVEIDNDVGDVTDKTTSSGDGTTDVTLPTGTDPVTYTLTVTPEDSQFQPVTQQVTATLEAQPSTTTTTAPSTTTTTAPSTTTTAPSTTTTAAPSTTTTTGPSTTTTAAAGGSLTVQGFFSFSPFMLVDESGTPVVVDGKNGITTTAIPLGEQMFLFGADGTAKFDGLPPGTYHVVYPTETDDSDGPPEPNPDPVQAGGDPVPVPVDNLLNTGFVASVEVKGSGQQSVNIDVTTDNNPSACC